MNVKQISLCGVIAALSVTVAAASPHGIRSASSSHGSIGRPAMSSGSTRNFSSTARFSGNQNRFSPRIGNGTGTGRLSGNGTWSGNNKWSGNNNGVGSRRSSGSNNGSGSNRWSGANNWSGSNHHHHHHHHGSNFVFLGGFGYPYWYDYYPYGYYDYYGQSAAYYDDGTGYEGSSVLELQQRLARAGYYQGAIDGIMGPATRRALRAYERDNGSRAYGGY
jgi:hypothetical protein